MSATNATQSSPKNNQKGKNQSNNKSDITVQMKKQVADDLLKAYSSPADQAEQRASMYAENEVAAKTKSGNAAQKMGTDSKQATVSDRNSASSKNPSPKSANCDVEQACDQQTKVSVHTVIKKESDDSIIHRKIAAAPEGCFMIKFYNYPSGIKYTEWTSEIFADFKSEICALELVNKGAALGARSKHGLLCLVPGSTERQSEQKAAKFVEHYNGIKLRDHEDPLVMKLMGKSKKRVSPSASAHTADASAVPETEIGQSLRNQQQKNERTNTTIPANQQIPQTPLDVLVQDLARNGKSIVSMRDLGTAWIHGEGVWPSAMQRLLQNYYEQIFIYDETEEKNICSSKSDVAAPLDSGTSNGNVLIADVLAKYEAEETERQKRGGSGSPDSPISKKPQWMKARNVKWLNEAKSKTNKGEPFVELKTYRCRTVLLKEGDGQSTRAEQMRSVPPHEPIEKGENETAVLSSRVKPCVEVLPLEEIASSSKYKCIRGVVLRVEYPQGAAGSEKLCPQLIIRGFEVPFDLESATF